MSSEYDLCFSPSSSTDSGSFKLIELPKDLCALLENAINDTTPLSLKVKGQHGEDAVLCTHDATFTMRSVALSNSVLVVTSPSDASSADFPDDAVIICDQVNEIIELTPSVPKLHPIAALLKGQEYDDTQQNDEMSGNRFTYEEALKTIQASDAELDQGMKDRHILNMNGDLRPIALDYLNRLLELILNIMISLSLPPESVPLEQLLSALANGHDTPRSVSLQVMSWFGSIRDGRWIINLGVLIKEVGLGILRSHTYQPIHKNELTTKWKSKVGDSFESYVDLALLSGNYLVASDDTESLIYFPASSLPIDAPSRFADLFLIRPRWKTQDIAPFLADIAVDPKERDKLLLKFARATTDVDGVYYTARAQYSS